MSVGLQQRYDRNARKGYAPFSAVFSSAVCPIPVLVIYLYSSQTWLDSHRIKPVIEIRNKLSNNNWTIVIIKAFRPCTFETRMYVRFFWLLHKCSWTMFTMLVARWMNIVIVFRVKSFLGNFYFLNTYAFRFRYCIIKFDRSVKIVYFLIFYEEI